MGNINKQKPNLIYIIADQLRYSSCGYTGDEKALTPNIDKLASESISFTNAISGHPVCAPYRASLFTGKYTTSTGMVINEIRINPNHRCFAHVLHDQGYDTAYIGKWHLWANEMGNHYDPKNSFIPPGENRLGFDGFWAAYNFHHEYYNTYYHMDTPEKIIIEGYEPDGQTDLAIGQLKEKAAAGKPFAMFLSLGTPHDPWTADNVPPEYLEKFRDVEFKLPPNYKDVNDPYGDGWAVFKNDSRSKITEWMRVYYAMTANLDWNVGRIIDAIDELGIRDNTIFIFTSDHGEMFGAQGRRGKNIFYEEAIRVPFLLRWPEKVKGGTAADVCLNTCDIMPTLLSMLEMSVPEEVEGTDLSFSALGKQGTEPEAAFLQGTGATAKWEDGHEWRALRSKQYTYAIYHVDRKELLFDNIADPYQLNNLANDQEYKEVLESFRVLIKDKMEQVGDTFESCTWYRDHWTEDRIILRTATQNNK